MRTPLNVTHLFYDKLPISPAYAASPHSGYEYLRDHLGYRLELETAFWPTLLSLGPVPTPFTFSATLRNWGFAAPVNPRPVYLVMMSPDKRRVLWRSHSLADPRDWQPYTPGDPFYTPQRHRFGATNLTIASADVGKHCPGPKSCALPLGLYLPDARPALFAKAGVAPAYSIRLANDGVGWAHVSEYDPIFGEVNGGANVIGELAVHQA
eukprot:SAG11_NODE_3276_length_2559_cov_1.853252_2_plen_209_part_00